MTLTLNPLRAMIMTYSHAKVQGQLSVGSEDKVETNGQTDGLSEAIALPPSLMKSEIRIRISQLTYLQVNISV